VVGKSQIQTKPTALEFDSNRFPTERSITLEHCTPWSIHAYTAEIGFVFHNKVKHGNVFEKEHSSDYILSAKDRYVHI